MFNGLFCVWECPRCFIGNSFLFAGSILFVPFHRVGMPGWNIRWIYVLFTWDKHTEKKWVELPFLLILSVFGREFAYLRGIVCRMVGQSVVRIFFPCLSSRNLIQDRLGDRMGNHFQRSCLVVSYVIVCHSHHNFYHVFNMFFFLSLSLIRWWFRCRKWCGNAGTPTPPPDWPPFASKRHYRRSERRMPKAD